MKGASYASLGAVLAAGAPLGLALLRALDAGTASVEWMRQEIAREADTYLYVFVSTEIAFMGFGYVLGRQVDRLADLSRTDPLTGLRNRRDFQTRLEEEFARALRYGAPLALLLVDLDGLKDLNDRLGHRAGDAALRRAAAAIRSGSRTTDIGARWGGDEFVLLAPNTGGDEAVRLGERVRGYASDEALAGGPALTVSIGVAVLRPEQPPRSPEALVGAADRALYEAKRAGRNRLVLA